MKNDSVSDISCPECNVNFLSGFTKAIREVVVSQIRLEQAESATLRTQELMSAPIKNVNREPVSAAHAGSNDGNEESLEEIE